MVQDILHHCCGCFYLDDSGIRTIILQCCYAPFYNRITLVGPVQEIQLFFPLDCTLLLFFGQAVVVVVVVVAISFLPESALLSVGVFLVV